MVLKPSPALALLYKRNSRFGNTIFVGQFNLGQQTCSLSDCYNVTLIEFCFRGAGSAAMSAVNNPISLIFGRGFPVQMPRSYTTRSAIPTRMRCFMFSSWRRAMNYLTHHSVDELMPPVVAHHPISARPTIRPFEAVHTCVRQNNFMEKFDQIPRIGFSATQRITVSHKTTVVPLAPTSRMRVFGAGGDRADIRGHSQFTNLLKCLSLLFTLTGDWFSRQVGVYHPTIGQRARFTEWF